MKKLYEENTATEKFYKENTELLKSISNTVTEIRKKFYEVTKDKKTFEEQLASLKTLESETGAYLTENNELENFDDYDAIRAEYTEDIDGEPVGILIDIYVSVVENYRDRKLMSTSIIDVSLERNDGTTTEYQDLDANDLAKHLSGDNVKLIINGEEVIGNTFVYDGCHKLYVIETEADRQQATEIGYIEEGDDEAKEYPISELEQYYLDSCPLRFIHPFSLPDDRDYVKQGDLYPEFIYHV